MNTGMTCRMACLALCLAAAVWGSQRAAAVEASATAVSPETSGERLEQDLHKRWTVTKWKRMPPGLQKAEHILEGESFEIAQVGSDTVIRPQGTLATRWGFTEKSMDVEDEIMCVAVMLQHGQAGIPKEHLVGFTLERDSANNPNPHGLDIHFPHAKQGLTCKNLQIHGGTAHAQD